MSISSSVLFDDTKLREGFSLLENLFQSSFGLDLTGTPSEHTMGRSSIKCSSACKPCARKRRGACL